MPAPVTTEAFAEYAADSRAAWVTAHLLQFGGITGMTLATVLLARAAQALHGRGRRQAPGSGDAPPGVCRRTSVGSSGVLCPGARSCLWRSSERIMFTDRGI